MENKLIGRPKLSMATITHVKNKDSEKFIIKSGDTVKVFIGTPNEFEFILRKLRVMDTDTQPRSRLKTHPLQVVNNILSGANNTVYFWSNIFDKLNIKDNIIDKSILNEDVNRATDEIYDGLMSGYRVVFETKDMEYELKTKTGIKGINIPVKVHVNYDKNKGMMFEVYSKSQKIEVISAKVTDELGYY